MIELGYKPVPGHSSYFVNDSGQFLMTDNDGAIVPVVTTKSIVSSGGRMSVFLRTIDGPCGDRLPYNRYVAVDRIVALVFIGAPENHKMLVLHNDGDVSNNNANNLSWVSRAEYIKAMKSIGAMQDIRGEAHHRKGKKHRLCSKIAMSRNHEGEKNGNYKGVYFIEGVPYHSSIKAGKVHGLTPASIIYRCKNNFPGYSFIPAKNNENKQDQEDGD